MEDANEVEVPPTSGPAVSEVHPPTEAIAAEPDPTPNDASKAKPASRAEGEVPNRFKLLGKF